MGKYRILCFANQKGGVGKTTSIGKIANNLVKQGKKVVVAAADTFRAAAVEQLDIWAKRSGSIIVKKDEGSDPASVVYDAIQKTYELGADVLIVDTAGRLHNKKYLMDELLKINKIIDREMSDCSKEVLLVLDAETGQNAISQVKAFKETTDITGIVDEPWHWRYVGVEHAQKMNELDIKLNNVFQGKVVRKDITESLKKTQSFQ